MAFQKLRELDRSTAGVGIPKSMLEQMGLIDHEHDGDGIALVERPNFQVVLEGDDAIRLERMPSPPTRQETSQAADD